MEHPYAYGDYRTFTQKSDPTGIPANQNSRNLFAHPYAYADYGSISQSSVPAGVAANQNFQKSDKNMPREASQVQIFVEGLPLNVQLHDVIQYFSTVGRIKLNRESRTHRVWLYKNKGTGELTGEATVTYVDRETQKLALQSYNGRLFMNRYLLKVTPAIVKSHMASPPILPPRTPASMAQRGGSRGSDRRGKNVRGSMRGGFQRREMGDNRSNALPYGRQIGASIQERYRINQY